MGVLFRVPKFWKKGRPYNSLRVPKGELTTAAAAAAAAAALLWCGRAIYYLQCSGSPYREHEVAHAVR